MAAKDNALKEAQERIALLEKNLQDMQKLAQIKSQTGAQLQQQAEAAKAASAAKATEPAKVAPAAKAEAPKAPEPAKAAPKTPEPAKAPLAAKAPEATRAPEPAKVPEATKAPEPAKAPEAAKAPETVKAPEPQKVPFDPSNPEAVDPSSKARLTFEFGSDTQNFGKVLQGDVLSVTDPAGVTTSYGYDGLGRLVTTAEAFGTGLARTTTVAYVPEKGWFWYIPQHRDRISVGVVAEGKYLSRDGLREPKDIFNREIEQNQWIKDHLACGTVEAGNRYGLWPNENLLVRGRAAGLYLSPLHGESIGVMAQLVSAHP